MRDQSNQGEKKEASFLKLRLRWLKRQDDLRAQFQSELGQVSAEDVVTQTRLKLKYRQRGLNL